eukprot:10016998-Ditylum_brightwellii.AAC.1
MKRVFVPSSVSFLDESMSIWTSKCTCPGWMFVPRKPHLMGNEYHTIACRKSGILYGMEIVGGKDRPSERPKPQYNKKGKTTAFYLGSVSQFTAQGKWLFVTVDFVYSTQ